MVHGRLIPTTFFRDPDVMSLSSGDVRLILVGLVLHADDHGRGMAHPDIVGRDLDYPPATIEAALAELEQAELLQCYQVGRHRYYVVTRWNDWQKLHKPTPSKYPAPPAQGDEPGPDFPGFSELSLENPAKSGRRSPESESESESKGNRIDVEEEAAPPPNVVPFPATRDDEASADHDVRSPILNPLEREKLEAHLHRNAVPEDTALASPAATSWQSKEDCPGPSDKRLVLAQHGLPDSEQGALSLDRERFTWTRRSCPEPNRSAGKVPVGELSLSGEVDPSEGLLELITVESTLAEAKDAISSRPELIRETTQQVASILHLPASEGLSRIVADYLQTPSLSLVGEADAAREWMDDPTRNRTGQHMSLAFIRRWLQREVEASESRKKARASPGAAPVANTRYQARTGTTGAGPPADSDQASVDPYEAFVKRRVAAVRQRLQEGKKPYEETS